LGKLLAEHVVLMVDVTRAAVTNTPDFPAAADAVNLNTRDLASAVDSLFGAPAAKNFQSLWAYHVEQLVAYAGSAAAQNAESRAAIRKTMQGFEQRFAAFLEAATAKRLDAEGLSAALLAHDGMLLRHADAFAARQYSSAHEIAYQTYEHMFDLARQLADAFGATVAARLPAGGPKTGQGGLADIVERR
jgi:leucyl aminopeptidase (aminopeptidase T)